MRCILHGHNRFYLGEEVGVYSAGLYKRVYVPCPKLGDGKRTQVTSLAMVRGQESNPRMGNRMK